MKRLLFLYLLTLICLINFKLKVKAEEQIVIPQEIQDLCIQYGEEYEICPQLIMAMCWQESRCKPNADNGTCEGLTQINPKYFKNNMELLGITDLFDAEQNIKLCAYTLSTYREKYTDVYSVLMCWNSGTGKAKELIKEGKVTPYAMRVSEISDYLQEREDMNGSNRLQRDDN